MRTLYKNQWVTEETVPSGQIHLLFGLMVQTTSQKNTPLKERKTPSEPWKWEQRRLFQEWTFQAPSPAEMGNSICACCLSWSKKLAALEAAEGVTIPQKAQTRLHTSEAGQASVSGPSHHVL